MEPGDEKAPKRARVVLSMCHEVVRPGYSRLSGAAADVMHKGENSGNPNWVNRVSKTEQCYRSRLTGLTKLVRLVKTVDWINKQIELARLLTRKDELWRTQLEREAGLHRAQGVGNRKKEKMLPLAGGQLHGGARGLLPRHKNVSYRSYGKKSWLKRKRRRIGTIGLTVLGP
jgi:hypothetical protein